MQYITAPIYEAQVTCDARGLEKAHAIKNDRASSYEYELTTAHSMFCLVFFFVMQTICCGDFNWHTRRAIHYLNTVNNKRGKNTNSTLFVTGFRMQPWPQTPDLFVTQPSNPPTAPPIQCPCCLYAIVPPHEAASARTRHDIPCPILHSC